MRGTDPADQVGEEGLQEGALTGAQAAAAGHYQFHQPRGQRSAPGTSGPTPRAPSDPNSAALYLTKLQSSADADAAQSGSRAWMQGAARPPPRHSGVPAAQGPWGAPPGPAAYSPYAGQALPAEVSLPRSTGTAQPDAWAMPPASALPRPQPGGAGEPRPYQHRYPQQTALSAGRGIGVGSPLQSGGWLPRSPPGSLDEPLSARRLELQASLGGASLSLPLGYGGEGSSGPGAGGEPAQMQAQVALVQLLATLQQGLAAAQQAQQARGPPPAWRWDGRGGGAAADDPAAAQQAQHAQQEVGPLQRSKPKPSPFQNFSVPWYEESGQSAEQEEGEGQQQQASEGEQPQAGGQGGAMVEVPTLPLSERLTRSTSGDGLSLQLPAEGGEAGAATPEPGAAAQPGELGTGGSEEYDSVPERKGAGPGAQLLPPSRVVSPGQPPLAQQQARQPPAAAAAAQGAGSSPAAAACEAPAGDAVARHLLQPAAEPPPLPPGAKAASEESPAQQPEAQPLTGQPEAAEEPGTAQPPPAGDLPLPSRRALTRRVSNPHVEMLSVLLDIEEQLVAAGGPGPAGAAAVEPGEGEGSRAGVGGKRLEEQVARLMHLQSEGDPDVQKLSLEILGTLLEAQKQQQQQPSQKLPQLPHSQERAPADDQPLGEAEQAGVPEAEGHAGIGPYRGQQPQALELQRWQEIREQWQQQQQQEEQEPEQWQPGQEQHQWAEQQQGQRQRQQAAQEWQEEAAQQGWQNPQVQQWAEQQEPVAAEELAVKSDDEIAAEALVAIMASEVEPSPQPKTTGRGPRATQPRRQPLHSPAEASAPPPLGTARVPRRRRSDAWGEGGGEDGAPPAKRLAAGGEADAVQGLYNHLLATYVPRGRRSSPGNSGGNSPSIPPVPSQLPGHEASAAAALPARPQLHPAQERSWPMAAGLAGGPGAGPEPQGPPPTRWLSPAEALQQRLMALQREQAQHQLGQAAPPGWQQAQHAQQQALAEQQQRSGGWWERGAALQPQSQPQPYSAFGSYPPHPAQLLQQSGGVYPPQQELGRPLLPAAGARLAPAPAPYALPPQQRAQQAQQQAASGVDPWRPTAQRPYTLLGAMGVGSTGAPVPVRAMPAGGVQPPPVSQWSLHYQQHQQQHQQQQLPAEAGHMLPPEGQGLSSRWAASMASGLVSAVQQGQPPPMAPPLQQDQQQLLQQLQQQLPPELAAHPLLQRYFQ